jgi:RNA polymerase sigma factor (sigma-70 family)
MSPSTLRRYRAERLLREEFGGLRAEVLGTVRGRLRARGVHLDGGDLEACYAQAWQGLYAAIAAGDEIANPGGWLTVVTFRRAIDEHRAARANRHQPQRAAAREPDLAAALEPDLAAAQEPDLAAALDDRARLRQLFEALRGRLNARECEAAALCYLQGVTRAEAAERMGISEARMGKLMEGAGPGRPGVARKVGELLESIRGGEWCEQQASTMRGLAFGILDPRGERYRLARLHQRECPACRAYILSLRGLAAVLPPLPLPWGVGVEAPHAPHVPPASPASHDRSAPQAPSTARSTPRASSTHGAAGAKAGAGAGAGPGTITASGAVGAGGAVGVGGAAGGGWLLGGSLGAKLAVSCVLALSVGCVALTVVPHHAQARHGRVRREASTGGAHIADAEPVSAALLATGTAPIGRGLSGSPSSAQAQRNSGATAAGSAPSAAARHAQREFGPEQPATASASTVTSASAASVAARAASRNGASGGASTDGAATGAETSAPASTGSAPPTHAEREFGPE